MRKRSNIPCTAFLTRDEHAVQEPPVLVCFSHLRWNFVFQRPQHLMSRFARDARVFFFEEPIFEGAEIILQRSPCPASGVCVVTPLLPTGTRETDVPAILRSLLNRLVSIEHTTDLLAWYYTPMAMTYSQDLNPALTIYDCMDELSAFANAPAKMLDNEEKLFAASDLVFTGGASLFRAKRRRHNNVHLFPSSVDVHHFAKAMDNLDSTPDQNSLPHPILGYAGVIDERMDLELIKYIADDKPEWQIVLIGPIVKIDAKLLPRRPNIHYLGMKAYTGLPLYLSGWDVALLPFAQNDATRFISPTKTPEYLAAGLPVVSTPIQDVIDPYESLGLVDIARDYGQFVAAVEKHLATPKRNAWTPEVSRFLDGHSWDTTYEEMRQLIAGQLRGKSIAANSTAPNKVLVHS